MRIRECKENLDWYVPNIYCELRRRIARILMGIRSVRGTRYLNEKTSLELPANVYNLN